MLELLENYEISITTASLIGGAVIGLMFGFLAQRSRFCIRRGLVGEPGERGDALSLWLTALVVAVVGTQLLVATDMIDISEHRFMSSDVALLAIALGGVLFGAGMVFARGCASRLTVLTGTGNMRALVAILTFAVVAHATLKGALAPARVWISSFTTDLGDFVSLSAFPGGSMVWLGAFAVALIGAVVALKPRTRNLIFGSLIGLLVPAGWFLTGSLLFDEFDPITMESLAFTSSSSESLFWTIAGTAIEPGFGVGFLFAVIVGSMATSLIFGEFSWQGFTSETPVSNYLIGGSLMGVGGVLAGGCTVGAGLTGVSTLSVAALLALVSIVIGAIATNALSSSKPRQGSFVPAE